MGLWAVALLGLVERLGFDVPGGGVEVLPSEAFDAGEAQSHSVEQVT